MSGFDIMEFTQPAKLLPPGHYALVVYNDSEDNPGIVVVGPFHSLFSALLWQEDYPSDSEVDDIIVYAKEDLIADTHGYGVGEEVTVCHPRMPEVDDEKDLERLAEMAASIHERIAAVEEPKSGLLDSLSPSLMVLLFVVLMGVVGGIETAGYVVSP